MIVYILCAMLFSVGIWGVIAKRNIVKIIISLCVMEYAIFLLFAVLGYRKDGVAPIETPETIADPATIFVDPLPQAIVLTAIVIGLGVTALMISTAVRIYHKYGTFDVRKVRRLKG